MPTYTVTSGDSATRVAGKVYGDQRMFAELKRLNPGAWYPGRVLNLPSKQKNPFVSGAEAAAGAAGQSVGDANARAAEKTEAARLARMLATPDDHETARLMSAGADASLRARTRMAAATAYGGRGSPKNPSLIAATIAATPKQAPQGLSKSISQGEKLLGLKPEDSGYGLDGKTKSAAITKLKPLRKGLQKLTPQEEGRQRLINFFNAMAPSETQKLAQLQGRGSLYNAASAVVGPLADAQAALSNFGAPSRDAIGAAWQTVSTAGGQVLDIARLSAARAATTMEISYYKDLLNATPQDRATILGATLGAVFAPSQYDLTTDIGLRAAMLDAAEQQGKYERNWAGEKVVQDPFSPPEPVTPFVIHTSQGDIKTNLNANTLMEWSGRYTGFAIAEAQALRSGATTPEQAGLPANMDPEEAARMVTPNVISGPLGNALSKSKLINPDQLPIAEWMYLNDMEWSDLAFNGEGGWVRKTTYAGFGSASIPSYGGRGGGGGGYSGGGRAMDPWNWAIRIT